MDQSPEPIVFYTGSPEEMMSKAQEIAKKLPPHATLCFFGEMGGGKTTFIKGLGSAFGISEDEITSPTFVYLNIYSGATTLYHFDLWRLEGPEDFLERGFEEILFAPGIKCIEWSEKIASLLPQDVINLRFEAPDADRRKITVEGL